MVQCVCVCVICELGLLNTLAARLDSRIAEYKMCCCHCRSYSVSRRSYAPIQSGVTLGWNFEGYWFCFAGISGVRARRKLSGRGGKQSVFWNVGGSHKFSIRDGRDRLNHSYRVLTSLDNLEISGKTLGIWNVLREFLEPTTISDKNVGQSANDSSFWKYKVHADIRAGSLGWPWGRQTTFNIVQNMPKWLLRWFFTSGFRFIIVGKRQLKRSGKLRDFHFAKFVSTLTPWVSRRCKTATSF